MDKYIIETKTTNLDSFIIQLFTTLCVGMTIKLRSVGTRPNRTRFDGKNPS
jgi:hypothetical protein